MTFDEDAILPSASVGVAAMALAFFAYVVAGSGQLRLLPTLLVVLTSLYAARQVQEYLQTLRDREHQERRIRRR